jgi:hypothetical protein
MNSFNTDTGTVVAANSGANTVAGVFFTLTPLVESEVLATHDGDVI